VSLFGRDEAEPPAAAAADAASLRATAQVHAAADAPRTFALLDHVFESICRPLKVR
jgi:hypothetical protein